VGETADFDLLIAAAADGRDEALTTLYRTHNPAVVRFLAGLVPDEAEDLAADTWIDMFRGIHRFAGDEQDFRRLLFTIARRRAIDTRRKRWRRRTDPVDFGGRAGPTQGTDLADVVADLDASRRAVEHIAALLPRLQAEVILLRVVGGLSVPDVAQIVGKTPAAVSVLQTRGLQRLASRVGDPARWERTTGRP
jgi:RNA polymerase sigma-70 factor (ECF subfamily)